MNKVILFNSSAKGIFHNICLPLDTILYYIILYCTILYYTIQAIQVFHMRLKIYLSGSFTLTRKKWKANHKTFNSNDPTPCL